MQTNSDQAKQAMSWKDCQLCQSKGLLGFTVQFQKQKDFMLKLRGPQDLWPKGESVAEAYGQWTQYILPLAPRWHHPFELCILQQLGMKQVKVARVCTNMEAKERMNTKCAAWSKWERGLLFLQIVHIQPAASPRIANHLRIAQHRVQSHAGPTIGHKMHPWVAQPQSVHRLSPHHLKSGKLMWLLV